MDALWEAESSAIRWLQGGGHWLAYPLEAVTFLGSQGVIIVLLAAVFWSVHAGLGARLFVAVIASAVVNNLFKSLSYGSRPYWFDAQVTGYSHHSGFGMPSGHSQAAVVTYGYLAAKSGRRSLLWAAVAVIALVAFSRIYLGVHYFSDVVVGLLVGGAILWAVLRYEDRVLAWWRSLDTVRWVSYLLAFALVPCLAATAWQFGLRGDWVVPAAEWIGATPADPAGHTLAGLYTTCGALLGGIWGFTLLHRRGWYSAEGAITARVARFALGISVVVLILVVEQVLFRDLTGFATAPAAFAVYGAVAFWATYGAPQMFVRSGLATRPEEPAATEESALSQGDSESAESAASDQVASEDTPGESPEQSTGDGFKGTDQT
ncbi:phosphatase PAP2 family protein [Nocardiopsis exhalans]|uniref:Phosphatase PAP2 family protein n=1 Tax=Nocardiopsis exhalans TaxID=163604 RepID=A0ABY5DGT2_9ACTN|nr:phosphatase PAP2 family protein [Nocardiopsis exhalans]USY23242.1 phosphatase PAP2 family protein [Nocardiopsis exhalans]